MTNSVNESASTATPAEPLAIALLLMRIVVGGAVFMSEGLQKFLHTLALGAGRFEKIGLPFANVMAPLVGATELLCGLAVVLGYRLRLVTVPLIIVMVGALVSTKLPILLGADALGFTVRELPRYGLLSMLHEARTDLLSPSALVVLWAKARRDRGVP